MGKKDSMGQPHKTDSEMNNKGSIDHHDNSKRDNRMDHNGDSKIDNKDSTTYRHKMDNNKMDNYQMDKGNSTDHHHHHHLRETANNQRSVDLAKGSTVSHCVSKFRPKGLVNKEASEDKVVHSQVVEEGGHQDGEARQGVPGVLADDRLDQTPTEDSRHPLPF